MKRISLTQGQFAIVDDKNFEWLSQWKWCASWCKGTKSYYAVRHSRKLNGKSYLIQMSRKILGLKYGDKRQADHRNHDTLDNCESNLRIATCQQNQWNQKNPKGYVFHKTIKRYEARIRLNGERIYLGCFETSEKAHNAYLKAKKKYHKI